MSIQKNDPATGFNGGFEHTHEGLPVNWQIYTSQTVPSGDFDVRSDTVIVKGGKRSLLFTVRKGDSTGGWLSPGLASQIPASPGQVYRISFWVKNEGVQFRAKVAGISATDGLSEVIANTDEPSAEWRQYVYTYQIPEKMNALRFEVNVLKPGTFRIDDVRLELQH